MPALATLSLGELNRATLARQMLLAREKLTAVRAVERLAGMQAQAPRPPFVGLWSRLHGFTREQLVRALVDRQLVRASLMRCTLHLMSAKDYLGLHAALQPALTRAMQSALRERAKGLDLEQLAAEARAFFDQQPRTFNQLRAYLGKQMPDADERAMGYAVRTQLPLVLVPTEAPWAFPAAADFAVAESWLGRKLATAADASALVLRYLQAFGPATPADAQAWSGLAGLKETFEALRPKLRVFRDARGRELFDLPDAPRPPADTPAPPRFVPEFDNLVLAHTDRTRVIADEHRPAVILKNLQVRATFLVDGMVAGTWGVERKRSTATLLLTPFAPLLKRARAALTDEAEPLVRFVEPEATAHEVRIAK
jgi:hypothetical protein